MRFDIPFPVILRTVLAASLLAGGAGEAAVSMEELTDISARIQYAAYEGDFRTLDALSGRLVEERARGDIEALLRYQSAYASYRAAELAPGAGQSDARYLARCEDEALAAVEEDEDLVDALALAGACAALDASRNRTALLSVRRARQQLRAARAAAPGNPRVLLLSAVSALRVPSLADGVPGPGPWLEEAARQFASLLPATRGAPDWGEAETAAVQAELAMDEGRVLEARDAAERALMLAPDYRRALTVMQKLSVSAR